MPVITMRFLLPEEEAEYNWARLGSEAIATLQEIERHCRDIADHSDGEEAVKALADEIRCMIESELLLA